MTSLISFEFYQFIFSLFSLIRYSRFIKKEGNHIKKKNISKSSEKLIDRR